MPTELWTMFGLGLALGGFGGGIWGYTLRAKRDDADWRSYWETLKAQRQRYAHRFDRFCYAPEVE